MADGLRVLIAYEAHFRAYGDALEVLEAAVECFDPHLVVSEGPNKVDPGGRAAWHRLYPEPGDPSEACLDAWRSVSENPGLEELLRAGREPGGC